MMVPIGEKGRICMKEISYGYLALPLSSFLSLEITIQSEGDEINIHQVKPGFE